MMYSRCIFCTSALGTNDTIEAFPVGRRLAFDGGRGRLWVVCPRCARWNLSPLEARWEAIEACEREFRAARRRVSTDNIALAALPSGLELVRIGAPPRPELAAWRYGRNFLRRRRSHQMLHAVSGSVMFGAGMLSVPITWPLVVPAALVSALRNRRLIALATDANGARVEIQRRHARGLRLAPADSPGGWTLSVPHAGGGRIELAGEEALRVAGLVLPLINESGAAERPVETAVGAIERAGTGAAFFRETAKLVSYEGLFGPESRVVKARLELRLALEMAAHEDAERRALEGELQALAAAWREADEIATIADELLVPPRVTALLDRIRDRARGPRVSRPD